MSAGLGQVTVGVEPCRGLSAKFWSVKPEVVELTDQGCRRVLPRITLRGIALRDRVVAGRVIGERIRPVTGGRCRADGVATTILQCDRESAQAGLTRAQLVVVVGVDEHRSGNIRRERRFLAEVEVLGNLASDKRHVEGVERDQRPGLAGWGSARRLVTRCPRSPSRRCSCRAGPR